MSFDLAMVNERDNVKSGNMAAQHGKTTKGLGRSEPDWSKFESVYAKDLLPGGDQDSDAAGPKGSSTSLTGHQASKAGTKPGSDKGGKELISITGIGLLKTDEKSPPKSKEDIKAGSKTGLNVERVKLTSDFLLSVIDLLLDYIRKNNDRSCKVLDFHHPHQLREMMSHCLDITNEPQNLEQILSDCKETLKYCVRTGHPRFFNQISQGHDIISLAGEWLTATANTNMFTYEVGPVFTLIEDVILTKMREKVGWPKGVGDGIFAPGGAISNLYSVAVARHKAMPESKMKGLSGAQRLVLFTSDQSHFSVKRSAALLGIGIDNVYTVKSDESGKMIVSDLEQLIEKAKSEGAKPFMVSATAGTTVLGAFDPIDEIADVCQKHKLWLHVDGAWGGGLLLSKKHKDLLKGLHRADSFTWNPHKLMGALLQCSAILIKEKGLLAACNSSNATYLFQQDKFYDVSYDTGDKAIQCGRHNDIFKLWLMWRAKGESGFEKQIDRLMDLSKYMQKRVAEKEGFEFILPNPEFLNVCFWYIPKNLRNVPPSHERDEKLHKIAPNIKAKMMEKGTTMVGYQPLGQKPNFFRVILSNPAATAQDIDFLLDEIERLGEEVSTGSSG